MIGEVELYGVYFPALLPLMLLAGAASFLLRLALARLGAYRLVWHSSLFNFALYVLTLAAAVALSR